jgi:ribosome biogenesis GTPase
LQKDIENIFICIWIRYSIRKKIIYTLGLIKSSIEDSNPKKEFLKMELENKITLIAGHSGTGKSTLINNLIPGLNLKTSEISSQHLKGKHTTTFAEAHPLPAGGYIIDSPGIREFGILDFEKNEVSHFFPEIFRESHKCKFNN